MTEPHVYKDGGQYIGGQWRYFGYSLRILDLFARQNAPAQLPGLTIDSWAVGYHAELFLDGQVVAVIERGERGTGSVSWLDGNGYSRFDDAAASWVHRFELAALRMRYGPDFEPVKTRLPLLDEFGDEVEGEFEDEEPEPAPRARFLAHLTSKALEDVLRWPSSPRSFEMLAHYGPY